jgi:tetratricopeptide (TPR) repeat protein
LNRGRNFATTGRHQDAIAAFDTVLDVIESTEDAGAGLPPAAYVEAFYRLGRVREAAGDLGGAVQDYRAALSVDPNYAPAIVALDELGRSAP